MTFNIFKTSDLVFYGPRRCPVDSDKYNIRKTIKGKNNVSYKIDINNLDELINLSKEYGSLIVSGSAKSIEIYDYYRE